jgi:hypothetical protein
MMGGAGSEGDIGGPRDGGRGVGVFDGVRKKDVIKGGRRSVVDKIIVFVKDPILEGEEEALFNKFVVKKERWIDVWDVWESVGVGGRLGGRFGGKFSVWVVGIGRVGRWVWL